MEFKRIAIEFLDECEKSPASFDSLMREIEKHVIILALNENGFVSRAAVKMRMNRTTLYEKMKKLGIGEKVRVKKLYEISSLEGKNEQTVEAHWAKSKEHSETN